jgi:hypothetical protein
MCSFYITTQKNVFKLVGCVLCYDPPYAEVVTQSVHSAVTPHQLLAKTVSCHRIDGINALLSSARSLLCTKYCFGDQPRQIFWASDNSS